MRDLTLPAWAPAAAAAFGSLAVTTLGGMAVADAVIHPEPASAGRMVDVRYQVVRAAAYVPPAVTEEARLDVRPTGPAAPDASLLPATWTMAPPQDAAPMEDVDLRRTLARIRAEDARLDRELKADLAQVRAEAVGVAASAEPAIPSPEPSFPLIPAQAGTSTLGST